MIYLVQSITVLNAFVLKFLQTGYKSRIDKKSPEFKIQWAQVLIESSKISTSGAADD